MLLTRVRARNFLSIAGECELPLDGKISVLLGANDHGKSNLLRALLHLNVQAPIRTEEENWDQPGPALFFTLRLSDKERQQIQELADDLHNSYVEEKAAEYAFDADERNTADDSDPGVEVSVGSSVGASLTGTIPVAVGGVTSALATVFPPIAIAAAAATAIAAHSAANSTEDDLTNAERLKGERDFLRRVFLEKPQFVIAREGVGKERSLDGTPFSELPKDFRALFTPMIPRVELFEAQPGELQDSVQEDEIATDAFEFLQGIFYYAGLDPLDAGTLFTQDDRSEKRLEKASSELDRQLRTLWDKAVNLGSTSN